MIFEYKNIKNQVANIKLPKEYEKFVWSKISNPIIYDRKKHNAKCYSCESTFEYDYHNAFEMPGKTIYHIPKFRSQDYIVCPICGRKTMALPNTSNYVKSLQTMIAWKDKETVYIALIDNFYYINKKDKSEPLVTVYPVEIFKFSQGKAKAYGFYCNSTVELASVYVIQELKCYTAIHKSVERTIKNSFLKYSNVFFKTHEIGLDIKKLALYTKYPQIEYIKKAGLERMVTNKLFGFPSYIKPNWKGRNLPEVLGITHQDIDKLKQWGMWNIEAIAAYKKIKKHCAKITKKQMQNFFNFFDDIQPFYTGRMKGLNPIRTVNYLKKQYEENRPECAKGAYGYTKKYIYGVYKDYIHTMRILEYPETDYYLYPKNLSESHDRVATEHRLKLDKEVQEQRRKEQECFAIHLEKMKKYTYSDGNLLIRPLENYDEFSKEGKNNVNCVASYFERVARRETSVFVVRRVSDPNKSFLTVEVKNGKLIQCRGRGNTTPPPEAKAFVDNWIENIVNKKKTAAPAA